MKNIMVTIPAYGRDNLDHMQTQLHNLLIIDPNKFRLDIHIFYYAIDTLELETLIEVLFEWYDEYKTHSIMLHKQEEDLGLMLPYECRMFIENNFSHSYDYYLYTENDLLITEYNLISYDKLDTLLKGSNYVSGFLRYENDGDSRSFPDMNGMHSRNRNGDGYQIIKSKVNVGGLDWFEPWNVHSSCFIFNKDQMEWFINEAYLTVIIQDYYKEIETLGSSLYLTGEYTKIYPINARLLDGIMIHHIPDKYIFWRDSPTRETLYNLLGMR